MTVMLKKLKMSEIDCANCAAKMERNINKLEGVEVATVSFLTKRLLLEVKEGFSFDKVLKQVKKEVKKIEPDCDITE